MSFCWCEISDSFVSSSASTNFLALVVEAYRPLKQLVDEVVEVGSRLEQAIDP